MYNQGLCIHKYQMIWKPVWFNYLSMPAKPYNCEVYTQMGEKQTLYLYQWLIPGHYNEFMYVATWKLCIQYCKVF